SASPVEALRLTLREPPGGVREVLSSPGGPWTRSVARQTARSCPVAGVGSPPAGSYNCITRRPGRRVTRMQHFTSTCESPYKTWLLPRLRVAVFLLPALVAASCGGAASP